MGDAGTVTQEVRLYGKLTGARMRGQLQYKSSFALMFFGIFAINVLELATIFILFRHFESLGGWRAGEVAFLYGLSAISFSIAKVFSGGLDGFSQQILRGEFDRVLTRPVSPFLQVLSSEVKLHQIGRLFQGLLAFGIALSLVEVDWSLGRLLYLPVAIVSAAAVFMALFALEATMCFWTTEATEAVNAFTYGGTTLAQYPLHVFDAWLRRLFLWLIPLGFTIFLPALYLLRKPDPLGLPGFARFVAPIVAVLFCCVVGCLWRLGIRHYRSTGS
ncbi:MAG: viologen exporter family transport system permease protein [Thermomicrobiales bacterium]|nr:viologen exporter family transport system permease protein [Thermomicrobiales bacterium]